MRVLLLSDNADPVADILQRSGIISDFYTSSEQIPTDINLSQYTLILIYSNVSGFSVAEAIRKMRESKVDTPVLVVSTDKSVCAMLNCFECGADDYLPAPFYNQELIARIHAIVRRSISRERRVIKIGEMTIEPGTRTVKVRETRVPLTEKEFQLLEALARRRGSVLAKRSLLSLLYNDVDEPNPKIVDVFVCKIRKKLDCVCGAANYIQTVWGRGYLLGEPTDEMLVV